MHEIKHLTELPETVSQSNSFLLEASKACGYSRVKGAGTPSLLLLSAASLLCSALISAELWTQSAAPECPLYSFCLACCPGQTSQGYLEGTASLSSYQI